MIEALGVLLLVAAMLLAGVIALANGMSDAPGVNRVSYWLPLIVGAIGIALLFL